MAATIGQNDTMNCSTRFTTQPRFALSSFIQSGRSGIGSMILDACEAAARAAGFTRFEMGATLTGVKLFQTRGYIALENLEIPIGNGISLPIVRMEKHGGIR
jgi:hypothetical protein